MNIYGNLMNRLEENKQFDTEIKVGDGVTIYQYSDRQAYEVVEVINQNCIGLRRLDHKAIGEPMSNQWELVSNEQHPIETFVRRKNGYWYKKNVWAKDNLDGMGRFYAAMNGFNVDQIEKKGFATRYVRVNLTIGKADYYYDYEF